MDSPWHILQLPTLCVFPQQNVLGSVPLMSCNLKGSPHIIIKMPFCTMFQMVLLSIQTDFQGRFWKRHNGTAFIRKILAEDFQAMMQTFQTRKKASLHKSNHLIIFKIKILKKLLVHYYKYLDLKCKQFKISDTSRV